MDGGFARIQLAERSTAMFQKITDVQALPGLKFRACFEDGNIWVYDVAPLQKEFLAFSALSTQPGLFEGVHLGAGDYGVVWNEDLDLASEEIWQNGRPEQGEFV